MANFIRKTSVPNLSTLKLANATPALQDFFHKVMMDLDKQPAGGLLIVNNLEELGPTTIAQFVTFNNITIDCIELPATHASYNKLTHELYLTPVGVSVFIHESNHFEHFVVDKGRWMSGSMKEKHAAPLDYKAPYAREPKYVYDAEYECGWRTLNTAYMYLYDQPELMNATIGAQLVNLSVYRKQPFVLNEVFNPLRQYVEAHKDEKNMHLIAKLILQLKFKIAGEFMKDKQFIDIYDIDSVNLELKPRDIVLINALTNAVINADEEVTL